MASEEWVLGGGCFWCLEAFFQETVGVVRVESGYAGGASTHPGYEQVCSGQSGHAEVVRITYDPAQIDGRTLLEIFFTMHDPTTLNRQGNDIGTQYRSVIFYQNEGQKELAQQVKAAMAGVWDGPIVTQIEALERFYRAEDYHQNYYRQHPEQGYCAVVIAPKVAKFRQVFAKWRRASPG